MEEGVIKGPMVDIGYGTSHGRAEPTSSRLLFFGPGLAELTHDCAVDSKAAQLPQAVQDLHLFLGWDLPGGEIDPQDTVSGLIHSKWDTYDRGDPLFLCSLKVLDSGVILKIINYYGITLYDLSDAPPVVYGPRIQIWLTEAVAGYDPKVKAPMFKEPNSGPFGPGEIGGEGDYEIEDIFEVFVLIDIVYDPDKRIKIGIQDFLSHDSSPFRHPSGGGRKEGEKEAVDTGSLSPYHDSILSLARIVDNF